MEVECNFKRVDWYSGQRRIAAYTGFATSIKNPGASVSVFKGVHQEGKTNRDVEGLSFVDKKVEEFPRGVRSFFPFLTCLHIEECGLKEISRRDLFGLENLKILLLDKNKLKALPDDLFQNMFNLEGIQFSNNDITRMSSKLFKPLNQEKLILADFKCNPSIDYCFKPADEDTSLKVLLKNIDEKCELPEGKRADKKYKFLMKSCEELYVNRSFSDYTQNYFFRCCQA